MKGQISVKAFYTRAIVRGFFADIILKAFLQMVVIIIIGGYLISQGMSEEDFVKFLQAPPLNSATFILLNLAAIISAFFGGYVAARFAKISEIMLSAILAIINILIGIFFISFNTLYPILLYLFILIIGFVATVYGGIIAKKQRLRVRVVNKIF